MKWCLYLVMMVLQNCVESESSIRGFISNKFFSGKCHGESCSSSDICNSSLCRVIKWVCRSKCASTLKSCNVYSNVLLFFFDFETNMKTRMEKVNIRSWRSIAKIVGTVICVSGAVSIALLKGPKLLKAENLPSKSITMASSEADTWFLGCLILTACCCSWSIWLILMVFFSIRVQLLCIDNIKMHNIYKLLQYLTLHIFHQFIRYLSLRYSSLILNFKLNKIKKVDVMFFYVNLTLMSFLFISLMFFS